MPRRKNDDEPRGLAEASKHTILAIAFIAVAIFLFIAAWGNAGIVGDSAFRLFAFLFGKGYYLVPVACLIVGISFLRSIRPRVVTMNLIGGAVFLISGLGIVEMIWKDKTGGIVGWAVDSAAKKLLGGASPIILFALLIISVIVILDTKLALPRLKELFSRKKADEEEEYEEEEEPEEEYYEEEDEDLIEGEPEEEVEEEKPTALGRLFGKKKEPEPEEEEEEVEEQSQESLLGLTQAGRAPYEAPPLSLLGKDSGKPNAGDIKANANIIKRTLANFGIEVEMDEVSIGPSITRYALKPAEGVKLSKIVGLQNDLSLSLAAHPLRIEAPIPGKSLVGIEIPNSAKTTIRLGSLLGDNAFKNSDKPLVVTLGKGISGNSIFANLAKMPHVLIAGSTGSGKSVTINTIITSLIYRNGPENLRFIMVDPKRVELTPYNNIPHLLTPVITNAKKTIMALKWAAKEMDRRYDVLESESVRDITSYHENIYRPALEEYNDAVEEGELDEEDLSQMQSELPEPLPYIVIVIDELADVMSTYPREMEAAIVRLAQMSRAVGIHLVLSTQRPSTEVITGLIKANVPARIALQVPSQIDSRTIIDAPGADKLLGAGDMLYLGSEMSKPQRLQSAFISEDEVKKVVKYIITHNDELTPGGEIEIAENNGGAPADDALGSSLTFDEDEEEDELYEEARETVVAMKKASASLLQRKLKVGYARAARLIDMLEDRGVVGPADGAKPREVFAGPSSSASDEYGEEFDSREDEEEDEYEEEEER